MTWDIFVSAIFSRLQIILQIRVNDIEITFLADSLDLNLYKHIFMQMIKENQTANTYFEGKRIKI